MIYGLGSSPQSSRHSLQCPKGRDGNRQNIATQLRSQEHRRHEAVETSGPALAFFGVVEPPKMALGFRGEPLIYDIIGE